MQGVGEHTGSLRILKSRIQKHSLIQLSFSPLWWRYFVSDAEGQRGAWWGNRARAATVEATLVEPRFANLQAALSSVITLYINFVHRHISPLNALRYIDTKRFARILCDSSACTIVARTSKSPKLSHLEHGSPGVHNLTMAPPNTVGNPLSARSLSEFMAVSLPKDTELKNAYETIALATHAAMIAIGFRLIGLGEDHQIGTSLIRLGDLDNMADNI